MKRDITVIVPTKWFTEVGSAFAEKNMSEPGAYLITCQKCGDKYSSEEGPECRCNWEEPLSPAKELNDVLIGITRTQAHRKEKG